MAVEELDIIVLEARNKELEREVERCKSDMDRLFTASGLTGGREWRSEFLPDHNPTYTEHGVLSHVEGMLAHRTELEGERDYAVAELIRQRDEKNTFIERTQGYFVRLRKVAGLVVMGYENWPDFAGTTDVVEAQLTEAKRLLHRWIDSDWQMETARLTKLFLKKGDTDGKK